MTVLVGGVGQLYQGDFDFGRRVVEILAGDALGSGVVVEDLHYGGVAVAQRLQDLRPRALVLVGAAERGRPPGTLERRPVERPDLSPDELQWAISAAVTGYVTIDLVVEVAVALEALPPHAVTIEIEPALHGPADELSPAVAEKLAEAARLVRSEIELVLSGRAMPTQVA